MKINENLDTIIDTIKESDIYINYKHILDQVRENSDIREAVKRVKSIQKRMVNEQYKKGNDITLLEKELENANKQINSIPLYLDYIEASLVLNELVKSVTDRLQTYINDLDI